MNDIIKKPTILIHGFGFDHRIWYPVELAFEGHHVIYLSLPGFGLEQPSEAYTIQDLANKYWRHINDIIAEPVHLAGHSMGGYVCMEMLSQQPTRVASLALIHSHVFADAPEKKEARSKGIAEVESDKDAFVRKFSPPLFGQQEKFHEIAEMLIERGTAYSVEAWKYGIEAIRDRADHEETLRSSDIPVLMLMGEDDKAVALDIGKKQSTLSDKITFRSYPGVGHLSMYENTSELITDLINFYKVVAD